MQSRHVAVDLGASNGRVILGTVTDGQIALANLHRFTNGPLQIGKSLQTDILGIYREILLGLGCLNADGPAVSVGIDSWGVDYGRLDAEGSLIANPFHYRDNRTLPAAADLNRRLQYAALYEHTGSQPFSYATVFQLLADQNSPSWGFTDSVLLTPDLLGFWLTGTRRTEVTIASTTGLLDPLTRRWSEPVLQSVGLSASMFPPLQEPNQVRAELLPSFTAQPQPPVLVSVASHDTASAVVAVPATSQHFAFISCGTWSLVGTELPAPLRSRAALQAGFTNELGLEGSVRFLRNITGLWLLQECQRTWLRRGMAAELKDLLPAAAQLPGLESVINASDEKFLQPVDMPDRITAECVRLDQLAPSSPPAVTRCILDSLALSHADAIREMTRLGLTAPEVIHIVGGGSRNELLCQLTANACGLPVLAGPTEAAALGNVAVQAHAMGSLSGGLPGIREAITRTEKPRRYEPSGSVEPWLVAARRLRE